MEQPVDKLQTTSKPKLSESIKEMRDHLDMFRSVAKLYEDHPKLLKGITALAIGAAVVSLFTKSRD